MILTALFTVFSTVIFFMLGSVNLGSVPTEVFSALSFIVTAIALPLKFCVYILSFPVFLFAITIIPLVTVFDVIFGLVSFVVRKIPFANIRM